MKNKNFPGFFLLLFGLLLIVTQNLLAGGNAQGASSGSSEKPLVFYSSVPEELLVTIAEMAKEAGFNVELINIPGADTTNRLIAEKNNPIADGVFGLNPVFFGQMKREDVLVKWEPVWLNKIDKTIVDPDGYYYPWDISPVFMMYNSSIISPATMAKDWPEIASNPAFKDKYTIYATGGQTSRVLLFNLISRYLDPKGELGVSAQGWDVMKKFIQGGHIEQSGEDTLGNLISGVRPMSFGWVARFLEFQKANPQVKLDIIIPSVGVPYVVQQVGIVKGSKNVERVKAFYNWFGAAEAMSKLSAAWNLIPANQDALKNISPEIQAVMNRLHPQVLDWTLFDSMMGAWVEKIQLEFVE
jgi:iron(III) transport system substrate-binding protein